MDDGPVPLDVVDDVATFRAAATPDRLTILFARVELGLGACTFWVRGARVDAMRRAHGTAGHATANGAISIGRAREPIGGLAPRGHGPH